MANGSMLSRVTQSELRGRMVGADWGARHRAPPARAVLANLAAQKRARFPPAADRMLK
jgi:hypothetical protein